MILIVYGYILLLCILLLICFYVGAYFGLKARMAGDQEQFASQEEPNEGQSGLQRSAT